MIWVVLLCLAIVNGGFREGVLIPRVGAQAGHVISTLMLCALILLATYVTMPWIRPSGARSTIIIGLSWLALTLAFEFGFGRFRGRSWAELLVDYNVFKGRVWVLVLITTMLAPFLAARARSLLPRGFVS